MNKKLILPVLAAAVVVATGDLAEANRSGGREGKPRAVRAQEVREARESSARGATTGADANVGRQVLADLNTARLTTKLTANQKSELARNLSNPLILEATRDAISQSQSQAMRDLAEARIEALSNPKLKDINLTQDDNALAALSSNVRAELAYANLAINAGKQASNWTPEVRENLTFLLTEANKIIAASGGRKSIAEAMNEANTLLARPVNEGGRAVRLEFDQVNKYCK
ncbi:MAG: hypothetical protein RBT63_07790 [Bdellovibrionales bacterium]|jgi:hypothetical protein|nr:hypothetical protein [Bdellovibrionales bacterium]